VLLGRPHEPKIETVNDLDCHVSNFWRAVQHDPEAVAEYADHPVNECDLHARHRWLVDRVEFRERMHSDPDHYDVKIAGWWVWGICQWIGTGWCGTSTVQSRQLPILDGRCEFGVGTNSETVRHLSRQIPLMSSAGMGVHAGGARLPSLGHSGRGIHSPERAGLIEWFGQLSRRLRRVRVACGDWSRIVSGSVTGASNTRQNMGMGPCAVFLDPPYAGEGDVYAEGNEIGAAVREWAIANGDNPHLRIALCGYAGEHEMPASWIEHAWKANGGYGNRNGGEANKNARRERIWFSPHCLPLESKQPTLFDLMVGDK
jgi:hypothetical protein